MNLFICAMKEDDVSFTVFDGFCIFFQRHFVFDKWFRLFDARLNNVCEFFMYFGLKSFFIRFNSENFEMREKHV